mmetsp:Transcript_34575/g.87314  ORF Transcript_34575/g.87314 Transcript_34575/m.87314 type:complete len:298 (+) Transcript_34575:1-894(+)
MLALMFVFVLGILGIVGDMHNNGVWEKSCPATTTTTTTCPDAAWSYATATDWGGTCSSGTSQSPINIVTGDAATGASAASLTDITSDSFQISNTGGEFNKRAVLKWMDFSLVFTDVWTYFTWDNRDWKFQGSKIHIPAEHTMDGKKFEVEIAMTFIDTSGKYLIMSFLGDRAGTLAGDSPNFIADIAALASSDMDTKVMAMDFAVAIRGLRTKCLPLSNDSSEPPSTDCLNKRKSLYYSYTGSFSVPPCAESVERLIFKEPISIRDEDYSKLAPMLNNNARPVQNLNSRSIKVSDST